ncbi:type 2 lantibiotic biosynthesis protein LanM [Lentzea xinjiangensis]|uniref:Type 2 lantibiotic biosynthesis protein LanM n=1 Tax=Lentzea xinjiangensis TaxID=402600 RepID=A0A1H9WIK8_9PSEU|nr:type 2 lanthipeptide synthetase LanM family protein [Lentzea xinjiangensis]SES33730.1 type 2 lantibiotic biosynthesis protein LanM [Lentzea xinjiangensis]
MEYACRVTPAHADVFAHVVIPWADEAGARLRVTLAPLPGAAVDPSALIASAAAHLTRRLTRLVTPVLVHELSRATGLRGSDEHERFADFLTRRHFRDYPVLVRELDRERDTAVESVTEIATRYAADRDRLTGTLLTGTAPLVAVVSGDRHRGGRATTVLGLADGQRVVHKPRGVAGHQALARLVERVNGLADLGLATVKAVPGNGYGWTEHIEPAPLPAGAAHAYFLRLGGLLAVLHLLRATDMNHRNVIARAAQPLLADVETLFQPHLQGDGSDPAAEALGRSVARTGILPAGAGRHGLVDISAAGGDAGQETTDTTREWLDAGTDGMRAVLRPETIPHTAHRPTWRGRPVEAADHADAVLSGFRRAYDAISRHKAEFADALTACASMPVRVKPRPTARYVQLLDTASRHGFVHDAETRLHALEAACAPDALPGLAALEAAELDTSDVPLFTARADGHDLLSAKGNLSGVFATSGLGDALTCLAAFDEADRAAQEWVIAASLATRRLTARDPGQTRQHAVDTAGMLSAARAVADRIVASGYGTERVNWIGLEPVEDTRWLVLPMSAGLAHGYTGVALFLAQIGHISEEHRYTDVARRTLTAVPELLAALRHNEDLIAEVGSGGLTGFAGIGYALARTATLLDDPEIARWARTTVRLAAEAAEFAPEHGLAPAMRAIDAEVGCEEALDLAERHPSGPTGPARWCRHGVSSWTDDLSLCHGELGRADVSVSGWSAAARQRCAGAVLTMLRRDGPRCVTPDSVPTPGLLTGLAGIGLGLLRLGFPERTPSVLLFEPSA